LLTTLGILIVNAAVMGAAFEGLSQSFMRIISKAQGID